MGPPWVCFSCGAQFTDWDAGAYHSFSREPIRSSRWRGVGGVLFYDSEREFVWTTGRWVEVSHEQGRRFREFYGVGGYIEGFSLPEPLPPPA